MLRILFAVGIAGLVFAGGSGTTQAAPILPLPAAATADLGNRRTCSGGDVAGVTAGDGCTVAVAGAVALAGALALAGAVAGVATAGVTAGAVCIAGDDSNLLT
jgi:hypothetical protein